MLASMTKRPSQAPGRGGNKKIGDGTQEIALEGTQRLAQGPCGERSLRGVCKCLFLGGTAIFLLPAGSTVTASGSLQEAIIRGLRTWRNHSMPQRDPLKALLLSDGGKPNGPSYAWVAARGGRQINQLVEVHWAHTDDLDASLGQ